MSDKPEIPERWPTHCAHGEKIDLPCHECMKADMGTAGLYVPKAQYAAMKAELESRVRELERLCASVANDDGLNDIVQGIGEQPSWWDQIKAVAALHVSDPGQHGTDKAAKGEK